MVTSEMKMRVAENCHRYKTKYNLELMNSITYRSESCGSCTYYLREKCTEELFNETWETIIIN